MIENIIILLAFIVAGDVIAYMIMSVYNISKPKRKFLFSSQKVLLYQTQYNLMKSGKDYRPLIPDAKLGEKTLKAMGFYNVNPYCITDTQANNILDIALGEFGVVNDKKI